MNIRSRLFMFLLVGGLVSLSPAGLDSGEIGKPQDGSSRLFRHAGPDREDGTAKCGLRTSFDIINALESLGPNERETARELAMPLQMEEDTVIGRFRIHFDTTNINGNEPALLGPGGQRIPGTARLYVDSVGVYFNMVWQFEIDSLGYRAPPFESGDTVYNVYVRNLGSALYGQTWIFPQQPINPGQSPPRYTTYIEVHNDFQPFFSQGIQGLKVTAAHEFHHAIQLGSYGFRGNDLYFYEITSTWMEDVVFDDVNDYYQYVRSPSGAPRGHFANPEKSFNVSNTNVEYSRAIWGKFIEKRFSRALMRRTWEIIAQEPSLSAINRALHEAQSGLPEAYSEFAVWNWFTGARADTTRYYTEGRNYPAIRVRDSLQFQPPLSVFTDNSGVESLGAVYFRLDLGTLPPASVFPIVVKTNIAEAGNGRAEQFQYVVRSDGAQDESYRTFDVAGRNYWAKVSGVGTPVDWILIQLTDTSILKPSAAQVTVYPNPFYISDQTWIRFRPPPTASPAAALYVFSSNLGLIHSERRDLQESLLSSRYFVWDGRTDDGGLAASGIYFYVLEAGGEEYRGKFTVVRK